MDTDARFHMLQNDAFVSRSHPRPVPPFGSRLSVSWGVVGLVVPVVLTFVLLEDLTTQVVEGLIDVDATASRGLVIRLRAPLLSQLECSALGDNSIFLQVAFVAHHDDGNIIVVFDADDLLSQGGQLVEGVHVGDGENEKKAISLLHVELAHGGELVCAGRVETRIVRTDRAIEQTSNTYISRTTVRPSTLRVLR